MYRHTHEGGLFQLETVERSNAKIKNRHLLPNEVMIDIARKSREAVFREAVAMIDSYTPLINYTYQLDDARSYLSWVQSNQALGMQ